jgi:capsular polysaccharide biosynthesis protein
MPSTEPATDRPAVLAELDRSIGHLPSPRVAVLVDGKVRPAAAAIEAWRPGCVVRLDVRDDSPRLHVRLAAQGRYDAVVDLVPRGGAWRLGRLLPHVRPGGVWVRRTGAGPDAVETVTASDDAGPLVADAEAADLLALDPGRGTVLEVLPGESWPVRGRLRTSGPMPANPTPARYDAPRMFLREYRDVVCLPRQVVVGRHVVLPESFTTVEAHRQRNVALDKLSPDFARSPVPAADPTPLPGRWFHLDNHLGWHFGHALTEQVSHLWGWRRVRAADPSVRALVFADSGELTPWQRDLLAAGGVPPDAVHVATAPVRVDRLVGCTPMFSRPAYVHPALLETYDAISAALSEQARERPWPRRVFLGRRGTKRACVNAAELEAEFTSAGFEVVYPEEHPLADQVELVRRAEVVAGYAGSAMFHIALAAEPKHVVLVVSESYPAHNEYLMSMLVGHRLDVVVCEPMVPRVDGEFTRESFHSDYVYRPEREGVFLRSVLADAQGH